MSLYADDQNESFKLANQVARWDKQDRCGEGVYHAQTYAPFWCACGQFIGLAGTVHECALSSDPNIGRFL